MGGLLTLNRVMVDWVTLTSFEDRIYDMGKSMMEALGLEKKDKRQQQYAGMGVDGVSGGMWVGTGIQKNQLHNMFRIWGELAHNSLETLANNYQPYRDNLKRLDAQVTIFQPDGWSQWELLERCRKNGRTVAWPKAQRLADGTELATVYIGVREASNRYTRVYQKMTDSGRLLLRLEVELKESRALQHGKHLQEFANGDLSKLRDELAFVAQQDGKLEMAFGEVLEGYRRPIKVQRRETNTADWIKRQCIPGIEKYLNLHSNDDTAEIAYLLAEIISKHVGGWAD